jgi:protein gp37
VSASSIQWTDRVWNPVVGCTKVSQGCKHCYAKTLHDQRHKAFLEGKLQNVPQYAASFETVQLMPYRLNDPLSWRKPSKVFVNSVSDLFHEDVPDSYIAQVFITMAEAERHTFQVLTKRPERMLRWFTEYLPDACSGESPAPVWPLPNVWLGVSVENQAAADERIPLLLRTPAAIRFLSCEPLLASLDFFAWFTEPTDAAFRLLSRYYRHNEFDETGSQPEITWKLRQPAPIHWVIVGGESGKGARPFNIEWAQSIQAQCRVAHVPLFVKQLGALAVDCELDVAIGGPRLPLRDRHGGDMAEWPEDLRVREFPEGRLE